MRKGNILIPVVIAFFSIAAFLGMLYYALPVEKKGVENENSDMNAVVEVNTNTLVITNTPIDDTKGWKTYTNTKYGFFMKLPSAWVSSSEFDGSSSPIQDDEASFETFSQGNVESSQYITFLIGDRSDGEIIHVNTLAYWKLNQSITLEKIETISGMKFTQIQIKDNPQTYFMIEHGQYFYQFLVSSPDNSIVKEIIASIAFENPNEKLIDIKNQYPFKRITNLTNQFSDSERNGSESHVSVMGTKALIGGWGKLFMYDGNKATDISALMNSLPTNSNDGERLYVRGLGNNGRYWLVAIANGETSYLYRYDGTTWTDVTTDFHAVAPIMGGQVVMAWNGLYWLLGINPYQIIKYDQTTFTNITSHFPINTNYFQISDIGWNGKYFLIPLHVSSGNGPVYLYDGTTATKIDGFNDIHDIDTVGWNGQYWLTDGASGQRLLKYDGQTITDTNLKTDPSPSIVWIKSMWLVGRSLTDGKEREIVPQFERMSSNVHTSIGNSYGIILDQSSSVYRFDF